MGNLFPQPLNINEILKCDHQIIFIYVALPNLTEVAQKHSLDEE